MKKYIFIYWLGSMKTECVVKADNKEEAEQKFKEIKGDRNIIDIEELSL